MTKQPEAMRLADELDDIHTTHVARNAAAELRRQHAEIESLRTILRGTIRAVHVHAAVPDLRFANPIGLTPAQKELQRTQLAQQNDPTDPGHDVNVLREHVRHLERRVRELHAQKELQRTQLGGQTKPLTGLDMFLDPNDGFKPKPYKPRPEPAKG